MVVRPVVRAGFFVTAAALVAAAAFLVVGTWMFLWPHSFYVHVAPIGPYGRHFPHDAGAFQVGIGVALLLALVRRDALFVMLTGTAVASWIHVGSHVIDRDLGGNPARDIVLLSALALLCTAGAVQAAGHDTR